MRKKLLQRLEREGKKGLAKQESSSPAALSLEVRPAILSHVERYCSGFSEKLLGINVSPETVRK